MSFLVDGVTITCCDKNCGISFQVPSWWNKGKRETHSIFYCPNGHAQSYTSDTEEEKIRQERDRLKQQMARVEQEVAAANARAIRFENKTHKLEKRVAVGTCPCCQRTFSNMSIHMRKQHPTFVAENVVSLKQKA